MLSEILNLPEMCPLKFRDAWGLSNPQVSLLLGIGEESLRSYKAPSDSKRKRNPSASVKIAAALWTREFLHKGEIPIHPNLIPENVRRTD